MSNIITLGIMGALLIGGIFVLHHLLAGLHEKNSIVAATVTVEEETETMSGSYTQTASGDEGAFHVVDGTESYDLHYRLVPCADDDPAFVACFLSTQTAGRVCEMTTL